jgi:predicted XRE-type DNA-binding protein
MAKRASRPRKTQPALISKAILAKEVAKILGDRGMTQTEAAYLIKDAPSQISLMVTGKTKGFSSERLLRTLTRLGRDVDIVIRPTAGKGGGKVRLSVR